MLDRLAAARERQRSFVADAAHELRSPLASMRAQLEVAERLGEGGTLPADLLADLDRLSGLVEDLLLLARSDADTRPAGPAGSDRRPRAAGRGRGGVRRAAGAGHRAAPARTVMIMADAEELRRAVDNLVANAVRHATHRVELAAGVDQDQVRAAGARRRSRGGRAGSSSGSSSGSPGWTTPGPATPAARGSGWPSCRNWCGARAAGGPDRRRPALAADGGDPAAAGQISRTRDYGLMSIMNQSARAGTRTPLSANPLRRHHGASLPDDQLRHSDGR